MKQELLICTLFAGFCTAIHAEPAAELTAAVKKLADAENYTWSSSTAFGDREARVTTGKKGSGGHVMVTVPMRDDTMQVLMRNGKTVAKTDAGWQTVAAEAEGAGDGERRLRFLARMTEGMAAPTKQVSDMIEKVGDLQVEEGTYTATLNEETAKELLSFRGRGRGPGGPGGGGDGDRQPPEITGASGTAKFFVKDGVLTKYELQLNGSMNFGGEDRDMGRMSTVEFTNIGSTSFDIPEEAAGLLAE